VAGGSGPVDQGLDVVEPEFDVHLVDFGDVAEQPAWVDMLQKVFRLQVAQACDEQLQTKISTHFF
jgi:hypothetical protein